MATSTTKLAPSAAAAKSASVISFSRPSSSAAHARFQQSLFITADFCGILSGALLAIILRFPTYLSFHHQRLTLEHLGIAVLYATLIVLFCHTQKLYHAYQTTSFTATFISIVKSILYATLLLGGCLFLTGIKTTSRLIILSTAISALLTMTAWRLYRRHKLQKAHALGLNCHNVLIIGTNALAQSVAAHLNSHPQFGFKVIGHLTESDSQPPTTNLEILGPTTNLRTLARTHFIDELIVCTHHRPTVLQIISDARESSLGVRLIPDLYDGIATGAHIDHLGDFPSLAVVHRSTPTFALTLKRAIDICGSLAALILLSPLMATIAALIKLDSRGPVFYASKRIGRKGIPFHCYKFRTMVTNADALKAKLAHLNERDGVLFKIKNDPRITRAGAFLRKHSLDELPQFYNVLKGQMSLVGPRPPLVNEFEQFETEYLRRLDVAPGITGLWQVEARADSSFDKYITLDLHYVENWSLALDLHILFKTVSVVLSGTGT